MINESIIVGRVILEFILIICAFQLGKSWLYALLVLNLLLVSLFGAKLIFIFGFLTNGGNVFYASIFLITHILIEHYGEKSALRGVWLGFGALVMFVIMLQSALLVISAPATVALANAQAIVFQLVPRIMFASLTAYLLAQQVQIYIYERLRIKTKNKVLWLRDTVANIIGQLLDSVVFFGIAFLGVLPANVLIQTMIVGFSLKIGIGFLGTPVLYLCGYRKAKSPIE